MTGTKVAAGVASVGPAPAAGPRGKVVIRPARRADGPAVLALMHAMGGHEDTSAEAFSRAYSTTLADPRSRAVVAAAADGAVLGYVEVQRRAVAVVGRVEGWLVALVVDPARRGQGTGALLVRAARRATAELGADTLVVDTSTWRTDAHRFYEREGFARLAPAERLMLRLGGPPTMPDSAPLEARFVDAAVAAAAAVRAALLDQGTTGLSAAMTAAHPGAEGPDAIADAAALEILAPLGVPVLSEESGLHGEVIEGEPWIALDPLDGTRNYRAGLPPYAFAAGLVQAGRPVAGVVHDLTTGSLWFSDGERATRDGRPIATRSGPILLAPSPSFVAPVFTHGGYAAVRCSGCTTVDLCRVADGTAAGWVDARRGVARVWDLAGPLAVLALAGGAARRASGEELVLTPDPFARYRVVAACDQDTAAALIRRPG